jgi:hypothetical protein
MASIMTAVVAYRPRIKLARTLSTEDVALQMEARTALNAGEIFNVLYEFNSMLRISVLKGHSVSLRKVGIFRPTLRLDGSYRIAVLIDPDLRRTLNAPGAFGGEIINRENIGKSQAQLVALWNQYHPEDAVEIG